MVNLYMCKYRENITALRERERKHRHAINMAKKSREQASKFLKETMTRWAYINLFLS